MRKLLITLLLPVALLAESKDTLKARYEAEKLRREYFELMVKQLTSQVNALNFQLQMSADANEASNKAKEANEKVNDLKATCSKDEVLNGSTLECEAKKP